MTDLPHPQTVIHVQIGEHPRDPQLPHRLEHRLLTILLQSFDAVGVHTLEEKQFHLLEALI